MENNFACFENTVFADIPTDKINAVKAAKSPLNTGLGKDVVRKGFSLLNAYAANRNDTTLKDVVSYVQFGRYICGVPMYEDDIAAALDINALLLTFDADSNTLKTCGISTFKKFMRDEL